MMSVLVGGARVTAKRHIAEPPAPLTHSYVEHIMSTKETAFRKHGASGTPAYGHWRSIIQRCENPKAINWKNYGGRGISICARWRHGENGMTGFECFIADMGKKPAGLDIDRINNDGNYEPGNCRWVTRSENLKNKRKRVICRNGHLLVEVGISSQWQCRECKRQYDRARYEARTK